MDRRQQKTKAAIFAAFEQLLASQKYSKITVRDIIDTAKVGRTTFYAHFETKDDLLCEMCTNLFDHVFSEQQGVESTHNFSLSEGGSHLIVTHMLCHLRDSGRNISRLMLGESSEIFLRYFRQYLDELVIKYLLAGMVRKNPNVPDEFLRNHISGSFVNMVQWWFRGGMKETPEELADYFFAVIDPIL